MKIKVRKCEICGTFVFGDTIVCEDCKSRLNREEELSDMKFAELRREEEK